MNGVDPRSRWNPTSLALLGDSVWELHHRRKHYAKNARVGKYQQQVTARVSNATQATVLDALMKAAFFTPEEAAVVGWALNSSTVKPPRHLDTRTYRQATALEAIVAYLYLTDLPRLQQLLDSADALLPHTHRPQKTFGKPPPGR